MLQEKLTMVSQTVQNRIAAQNMFQKSRHQNLRPTSPAGTWHTFTRLVPVYLCRGGLTACVLRMHMNFTLQHGSNLFTLLLLLCICV